MKRIILSTIMAAILCLPCFGKGITESDATQQKYTVDALFLHFSKEKKITHVKVGGIVMAFARVFSDTKGVKGVEVYSFEECDLSVKEKLNTAITNLKDNAYETLVSTTQNGEKTKVLIKIKEDYIHEIVVIAGGSDPALVRIKGKIKPDDVQNVVINNK